MITLKGSQFIVSYNENSGEHSVFVRSKDGYNNVTNSLSDEEKNVGERCGSVEAICGEMERGKINGMVAGTNVRRIQGVSA